MARMDAAIAQPASHSANPGRGASADLAADDSLAAALGLGIEADYLLRARRVLAANPAVDAHSHAGRFFMRGAQIWHPSASFFAAQDGAEEKSLADMRAGGLGVACVAVVPDMRSLVLSPDGALRASRALAPGECFADTERQFEQFDALLGHGTMALAGSAAEVPSLHGEGRVAAILAIEGADFLEGDIERLAGARAHGVRTITLVHYRVNGVGDLQTEPPVHGGLSGFGARLVREMNATGLLVDLAHASFETTRDTVALTTRPVMLSHSHLEPANGEPGHARLISPEHARLIASTGGVIGAWPAGFVLNSVADYIDEILRLIDVVGVDHVCIGTDMDANYRPVFDNYRQLPLVVAMLAQRGLDDADLAKVASANFLRVLAATEPGGARR